MPSPFAPCATSNRPTDFDAGTPVQSAQNAMTLWGSILHLILLATLVGGCAERSAPTEQEVQIVQQIAAAADAPSADHPAMLCDAAAIAVPSSAPSAEPTVIPAAEAGQGMDDPNDKTGSNPLNRVRKFSLVNEFDDSGNSSINYTYFRYYHELVEQRIELRLEVPLVSSHNAIPDGSSSGAVDGGGGGLTPADGVSDFGLGDVNLKVTVTPYLTRTEGFQYSVEVDFPTASSHDLGTGKYILVPTIMYGWFLPGNMIFAPAYEHKIGIAGDSSRDNINSANLDFYLVKRFNGGDQWIQIDPTYKLNYEKSKYCGGTLRITYGQVLGHVGQAKLSGYVRPGVGIGVDRPYEWSMEMGVSISGF
jgi:hypothetical protein